MSGRPGLPAPPDPEAVRALLVRAPNWIGDVVMASPALHALRTRFPGARLSVLARSGVCEALAGSEDLDELIEYDRAGIHGGLAGRLRLVGELRRRRFDHAVLFPKSLESALIARGAGIRSVTGLATDGRGRLLSHPVPPPDEADRHHAEIFLDVAAAAEAGPADRALRFPLADGDREAARTILEEAGVANGEPIVAVHPGASKTPRAWHAGRFGAWAREAARLTGARPVVCGGRSDGPLAAAVREAAGEACVDLTGRTTLRQMAAVFERARVFLGSDSGPMHVAAAVGTPVAAVFGPGRPEKTAPFVSPERVAILDRRFPCSPCRQKFFRECEPAPSGKPWCLEEVRVAEAVEALGALLSRCAAGC